MSNKKGDYTKPELDIYLKKLIGDSLVATEGKKWVRQRKLANRAFHGDYLTGMIPAMVASVEAMRERWKELVGQEIEVLQELRVMTSDVIARTAFGSSFLEGRYIFDMLLKLGELVTRNTRKFRFLGNRFVRTKDDIESDILEQEINKAMLRIMRSREEKVKLGEMEGYGCDLLGLLVQANQEVDEDNKVSTEEAIDECKSFYFGGHETTSALLTWTMLLLAKYIDWQSKARKEVLELFGDKTPTLDGIAHLKTMNMIINETLRLYPPALIIPRKIAKEVNVGRFTLPKDLEVEIPTIALHHDPQIWGEDVHLFNPERFSRGVSKAAKEPMSFMPFGLGPRFCIGQSFATIQAKLALAMILQHFQFTLSPTYAHGPILHHFTSPQYGVQIKLHAL